MDDTSKFIVTEWFRDWAGSEPQMIRPAVLDLANAGHLKLLIHLLGNGEFDVACFEVPSVEVFEALQGAFVGTGAAIKTAPTKDAESCRLFRAGYEIYRRGGLNWLFLNPRPRPALFAHGADLAAYVQEFTRGSTG